MPIDLRNFLLNETDVQLNFRLTDPDSVDAMSQVMGLSLLDFTKYRDLKVVPTGHDLVTIPEESHSSSTSVSELDTTTTNKGRSVGFDRGGSVSAGNNWQAGEKWEVGSGHSMSTADHQSKKYSYGGNTGTNDGMQFPIPGGNLLVNKGKNSGDNWSNGSESGETNTESENETASEGGNESRGGNKTLSRSNGEKMDWSESESGSKGTTTTTMSMADGASPKTADSSSDSFALGNCSAQDVDRNSALGNQSRDRVASRGLVPYSRRQSADAIGAGAQDRLSFRGTHAGA